VERGKLLNCDRPRLDQPAQVYGQIGQRRLDQHPFVRLVQIVEQRHKVGISSGRWRVDQWSDVLGRFEVVRPDERPRPAQQRSPGGVAADVGHRAELIECPLKRCRGGPGLFVRNRRLPFQGAGFGCCLFWRVLRFGGQVRRDPFR
jgi:hypothetical protein